jgi:polyhydroxybutyrate depolymerase
VGFIDVLIDSIAANYNIDLDRIYACGMSNGGYMAYELACELSSKITAFGSVTGNFMLNSNQVCDQDRDIPIIHIHGTADEVVNYYPPSFDGSLTVGESIDYWSDYNNLTMETIDSINANVEKYTYANESSTRFVHFKVYGGGHAWFYGSYWGFHSSEELINFFLEYRLSDFQTTDIIQAQDNELPTNFILHQNYPNPFNPSTTIRFSVKKRDIVSLQVFDLTGKLIKTLRKGALQPGIHEIKWNGVNDLEEAVSSDVYLYVIRTENAIQSRKMILLK